MRFFSVLALAAVVLAQTDNFDAISKPTNAEYLTAGSTYDITWEPSTVYTSSVSINLLGGSSPTTLQVLSVLGSGVDNTAGTFSWDLASDLGTMETYGIQIVLDADNTIFQYSFPFHINAADSAAASSSSNSSASTTDSATDSAATSSTPSFANSSSTDVANATSTDAAAATTDAVTEATTTDVAATGAASNATAATSDAPSTLVTATATENHLSIIGTVESLSTIVSETYSSSTTLPTTTVTNTNSASSTRTSASSTATLASGASPKAASSLLGLFGLVVALL